MADPHPAVGAECYALRPSGAIDGGFEFHAGDAVTVGRDPLNRLQIGHLSVAPFHCRLTAVRGDVKIHPIGAHSVRLDGQPIKRPTSLPLGSSLEIGQVRFVLLSFSRSRQKPATPPISMDVVLDGLRSTPWYVISLFVHLIIFLLLQRWVFLEQEEQRPVALRSDWVQSERDDLLDIPKALEAPEFEDPEDDLEDPTFEPAEEPGEPAENQTTPYPITSLAPADLMSGRSGTGGGRGLHGGRRLVLSGNGASIDGDLVPFLRRVRGSGMDLVFLIDTTASMKPFLERAKRAVDDLVTDLAALVEDLGLGIVAFRDYTDSYVTRVLEVSQDRYEIFNFLEDLKAGGGGNIPEAVAEGFDVVAGKVGWRRGTYRVVVIIGDAPPHARELTHLKSQIRRFVKKSKHHNGAVVSTIFTGGENGSRSSRDVETARVFADLARAGQGDFLELSGSNPVGRRLMLMALGRNFEAELGAVLNRLQEGPREKLILSKSMAQDVSWLVGKLDRPPIHPAVVNSLIRIGNRDVLQRMRALWVNERKLMDTRQAALYVLRRLIDRPLRLSLDQSVKDQEAELSRLDLLIGRY